MSHSTETQAGLGPPRCYLIYDRDCQLCVSIKNRLSEATEEPSRVNFVPYDSQEAKSLLGVSYVHGRPEMAYLIDTDGKKHQGLDAFIPFLSVVPWGKWILPLWKLSFFRAWGYAAYKVVAKYRYVWFGEAK